MKGGACDATEAEPAHFDDFTAWNCMRGAESDVSGAVRFRNNVVLDNDLAGIEVIEANEKNPCWGGPKVMDSLVVGHSLLRQYNTLTVSSQHNCTVAGVQLPMTNKLVVSNVTFVNFDENGCHTLRTCAHCAHFDRTGSPPTRFEKLTFINSEKRAQFEWLHQAFLEDLDGTLTGFPGATVLPHSDILDPSLCKVDDRFSDRVSAAVCKAPLRFKRISWNKAIPSSVKTKDAFITTKHGTAYIPFKKKAVTHGEGWTTIVPIKYKNTMGYRNQTQFTNISYALGAYDLESDDWFYLQHQLRQVPDFFKTTRRTVNASEGLPDPSAGSHGDWHFDENTKVLTILIKGQKGQKDPLCPPVQEIQLTVYRCFFDNCILPTPPPAPQGRPENAKKWSKAESWTGARTGYAQAVPNDGDDVIIMSDWWMVHDLSQLRQMKKLNRLYIYGALELENGHNHYLSANVIFISGLNGMLIVGWPHKPMLDNVIISLRGNWDTPDIAINNGLTVGAKAIGVFARLQMIGKPRETYWTRLAQTANAGDEFIDLVDSVDWVAGEEIIISSTSYQSTEAEKIKITAVENNKKRLRLNGALQYKHLGDVRTIDGRSVPMQAKVGLLTRNIRIEGVDDPAGSLPTESFGGRVLVGKYVENGVTFRGKAQVKDVQFKNCGQHGWNEPFDPR